MVTNCQYLSVGLCEVAYLAGVEQVGSHGTTDGEGLNHLSVYIRVPPLWGCVPLSTLQVLVW